MSISSLIPVGAWLWDKFGTSLTQQTAGLLRGRWRKFKWNDAAEKYRAKVQRLYGAMQIMGMAKPVPLDDIFTDLYMLDKPTAFSRFDIESLKQLSRLDLDAPPRAQRINGLKLVVRERVQTQDSSPPLLSISLSLSDQSFDEVSITRQHRKQNRASFSNLFILGKPGAGKTTFLKYIAIKAAEQTINKVPIFISLKEWADSRSDLASFIAKRFDICDFPDAQVFLEELLKAGNAIVLFDGLDEVNQQQGQRDKQTRAMNAFVERYDRTQCLITCRIAASDYSFQPFTYVEIADFTEKQIRVFVGNWFRTREGEKDQETSRRFLEEFGKDDNKGLRNLARTPLLLTLLCLAFDETMAFPKRRVEVYKEALDALLKKWDSSRRIRRPEVYRTLSLGHKENMLAQLAAQTFERNQYFIPQEELEKLVLDYVKNVPPHDKFKPSDVEAIIKAIEVQHGIFVERARGVYSFSHLTFQEYFTAKYIVAKANKRTLTDLIKAHCADPRWREVFLLTTSLLPDASEFVTIYRCAIDEILGGEESLRALLLWTGKKSSSIPATPGTVRPSCLFIELYHRVENPNLEVALDLGFELGVSTDISLDLDLIRAFDFAKGILECHLSEAGLVSNTNLGILAGLVSACGLALIRARELSRDLSLTELGQALRALRLPAIDAPLPKWNAFFDELQSMMMDHRDIGHSWRLTFKEQGKLADYLRATYLLRDCLRLAFMSPEDKTAMLNDLYLPLTVPPVR